MNHVFPCKTYKPAFRETELDCEIEYDFKEGYKCSALIHLMRSQVDDQILKENVRFLFQYNATLDVTDSDGRDAIMYPIILNNLDKLRTLLAHKEGRGIKYNRQDLATKSHVHYVVNPLRFGSFENVKMLELLHKEGFDMELKDSENRSAASYSMEQETQVMFKAFARLLGGVTNEKMYQRAISMVRTEDWPTLKVDFEADCDKFLKKCQERDDRERKENKFKVPVDATGKLGPGYEVVYQNDDKPFDIYMLKVDLKNGVYGDYVFYKMQLLYEANRDLYVVFTRWGRIGEDGMNQRTPFNNLDEAIQDFKKIYKSKTSNEWDAEFEKKPKKYNIAHVKYHSFNYKDYLAPFDLLNCPRSKLDKPTQELIEEIAQITVYQRAMSNFGIDSRILPFHSVKKEVLIEAKHLLMELSENIKEDAEISKDGMKADFEALIAVREKNNILSNKYYELIP